ncbi:MAG: magnesium transporter CorA [Ruminiclostridium sp.]|nr:magnesium transporter CorA [Ruminococcus sp.]MBP5606214.1 magnesium transporter CorA [Ruminiclostridium sp.]
MYYYIKNTLEKAKKLDLKGKNGQFVAVLTSAEWLENRDKFDMGIEMDIDLSAIHSTKAEVNYDSLTGTFSIPDRDNISAPNTNFAFALDEKGIVFIDDSGFVDKTIRSIISSKRWTMPSLERFIYDFLEQIVARDQIILERVDKELDTIESNILDGDENDPAQRVSRIRSDLRDMRIHYEQLLDLGQELEENENDFFNEDNTRYFHLFTQRISRLHDLTSSLREYSIQIRDLYQSKLDIKQNRIMALLTIITSIFMPLTLIAGWYGMNFRYMPELEYKWAYPAVIVVSIVIVIVSLVFFKKKKWL